MRMFIQALLIGSLFSTFSFSVVAAETSESTDAPFDSILEPRFQKEDPYYDANPSRAPENLIEGLNLRFQNPSTRIVNGDRVAVGERAFQVALHRKGRFICGGSLIGKKHVLTAAHCVDGNPAEEYKVLYGTLLYKNGSSVSVDRIFAHPNYDKNGVHDDIAVLRLSSAIQPEVAKIAHLPINRYTRTLGPATEVVISGWGRTARNHTVSEELLKAEMQVVPFEECKQAWSKVFTVQKGMLCAKDDESSACHGDSGSPLTMLYTPTTEGTAPYPVQVGVVSVGSATCFSNQFPNVYTDVYHYRDWIARQVRRWW